MTNAPATNTPPRTVGRWAWLGGLVLAIGLAVVVGLGVSFAMAAAHEKQVDALVEARVAEQAALAAQQPQGPPPASVKIAQVTQRNAQKRIEVVGRLREVKRAVVASEVEGRVIELLTPAGRRVVGGQTVIARVDPVWSELAVEQARADLAAAQATARQSANDLANLQRLAERGSADPQELDDGRARAQADAASVLALEAALNRAQTQRNRVEIIAPFDGTVTEKLTEQGQWVDPGGAVVEVVSRGQIDAVIDVPEQHISALEKGTPIELTVEPLGERINGAVVAINPDGSNAARTYRVKVRFDDRGGLFKVGMSVTARVPVGGEASYLVVPRDAVQYAGGGPQVWMSLVMPGSAPGSMPVGMPMDVAVLFGDGDVLMVRPKPKVQGMDLFPGMEVVVQGAERLWPTRPLMVLDRAAPGAEAGQAAPAGGPEGEPLEPSQTGP